MTLTLSTHIHHHLCVLHSYIPTWKALAHHIQRLFYIFVSSHIFPTRKDPTFIWSSSTLHPYVSTESSLLHFWVIGDYSIINLTLGGLLASTPLMLSIRIVFYTHIARSKHCGPMNEGKLGFKNFGNFVLLGKLT